MDRLDLFTTIHKGLRWWIGDVGAKLGALDADERHVEAVAAELDACLSTLEAHSVHEETFVAPFLDQRGATRAAAWHHEHETLDLEAATLRRQARHLVELGPGHPRFGGQALELYRGFSRFASATFLHLDEEETRLMPLLWSTCTDEELRSIMTAFREKHGEESAALYARFAPAFNSRERELLGV